MSFLFIGVPQTTTGGKTKNKTKVMNSRDIHSAPIAYKVDRQIIHTNSSQSFEKITPL